jgi:hypothetical protein
MSIRAHETPPKPVETNMSHTDKRLWKKLAGAFKLLQGFGGYTRGCASTPPWNSTTTRKEECSISKLQPLRVPNRYHCRVSGATIGDNYKGHLITGETPLSKNNKKQKNKPTNPKKTRSVWSRPKVEGPTAQKATMAHQADGRGTPWASLCLARGLGTTPRSLRLARGPDAPSGESSPRSRDPTHPRASLHLARGPDAPSGESPPCSRPPLAHDAAPTPPTRALNALARHGRSGQRRIPATPTL